MARLSHPDADLARPGCDTARASQLVWECRTDASKFFFPSPDFNPSPTPAMLSCAALESSEPQLPPWRPLPAPGPENGAGRYPSVQRGDSNNNNKPAPAGRRSETRNELLTEQSSLHSSVTGTGESWGSTSGRVKSASSKNRVRQQECGGGDGGGNGGGGGSGGGGGGGIGGSGRGGGGGGKGGRGRNLMRPFTIDVHEEVWTRNPVLWFVPGTAVQAAHALFLLDVFSACQ